MCIRDRLYIFLVLKYWDLNFLFISYDSTFATGHSTCTSATFDFSQRSVSPAGYTSLCSSSASPFFTYTFSASVSTESLLLVVLQSLVSLHVITFLIMASNALLCVCCTTLTCTICMPYSSLLEPDLLLLNSSAIWIFRRIFFRVISFITFLSNILSHLWRDGIPFTRWWQTREWNFCLVKPLYLFYLQFDLIYMTSAVCIDINLTIAFYSLILFS